MANNYNYKFSESSLLLNICETIDGKFCIRPIRWSASYSNGKMINGEYLEIHNTKEKAINRLVENYGYSRDLAISLS